MTIHQLPSCITTLVLLALLLTAPPHDAAAADAAQLEIIGFSADGRYFAFEQFGHQSGSGAAYSWIDFYDVPGGRYADETKRVVAGGREGQPLNLESTRSEAMEEARPTIERLKIAKGNTGGHVVSHPLTDLGADSSLVRFSVWTPLRGMPSQDYSLELRPIPTTSERCYFDEQAYIFELYLVDNGTGGRTALHRDEYLPEDRRCALAYRISDVVVFEPVQKRDVLGVSIVVFVNIFSTGFEGHDMRYTVVGGTLK
jgi:predicted secreted protein